MSATVRYPAGDLTPHGWWHIINGTRPMMRLRAYDGSIDIYLMGGLAPPYNDPTKPEGVALKGLKGLIPPWHHIDQKGATEDGITQLDALYEPIEVEAVVECFGRNPRSLRRVHRDLIASIDAKQQSELSFLDLDMGYWWAPIRWFKGAPPDPMRKPQVRRQQVSLRLRADSGFWRSYDDTATFGFTYSSVVDEFDYTEVSDDFNRANTATLGTNWVNRNLGLAIDTNTAIPTSAAGWNTASHVTAMTADDMEVSVTFGAAVGTDNRVAVVLGANTTGQSAWAVFGSGSVLIYTMTDWGAGGLVQRDTDPATFTTGDILTFRRVGNVYTTLKNGVAISGSSWTDSANVLPRDASHRLVGLGLDGNPSLANYRRADAFSASTAGAKHWPIYFYEEGVAAAGFPFANGSQMAWSKSGTTDRGAAIGPYKSFDTTTDNQVVEIQLGCIPEITFQSGAFNDIWGRMSRNADGTWKGDGIRARVGLQGFLGWVELARFNNFVKTTLFSRLIFIPPQFRERFTLVCGVGNDPRMFRILRNGCPILSHKETGTGSLLGAAYRGVGFGMKAGAGTPSQKSPAWVDRISAGDNATVTQSGFLARTNIGDQKMYDDYTFFGPGTVRIWDGPGAGPEQYVEFGPLLANQAAFLRTDPRDRNVYDLASVPANPSQQERGIFDAAFNGLLSFFTAANTNPLLQVIQSIFGIFGAGPAPVPPQGNFYALLKGRFSDRSAIPAKSPGNPAQPYYTKVQITSGNADSKVIASGVPLRRYPL